MLFVLNGFYFILFLTMHSILSTRHAWCMCVCVFERRVLGCACFQFKCEKVYWTYILLTDIWLDMWHSWKLVISVFWTLKSSIWKISFVTSQSDIIWMRQITIQQNFIRYKSFCYAVCMSHHIDNICVRIVCYI